MEEETNMHLHSTKHRDVENRTKILKRMERKVYRISKAPLLEAQLKKMGVGWGWGGKTEIGDL